MNINSTTANAQFLRFLIVGMMNTAVTLIVIFLCKSVAGMNLWLSNALGYIAGVINSFVMNRSWVFHSKQRLESQIIRFILGFGVCYLLQLAVTWSLTELTPLGTLLIPTPLMTLSGYGIATLIGMGCYTVANFVYNRLVAFR